MLRSIRLMACVAVALSSMGAEAATIDRVRSEGVLRCGSAIRPGLAFPAADGGWQGLNVELCRAIGVAVLGPGARIAFHGYASPSRYDGVRAGADEVAFLTAAEVLAQGLLGAVVPGPPVFFVTHRIMVAEGASAQTAAALGGKLICAEPGTGPERSLGAWFEARGIKLELFMFQEAEEMLDAYYAGRCAGIAQEATSLAALRLQAGQDGHPSRILPDILSALPVMAVTGVDDGRWTAIVGWAIGTLERAETEGRAGPGGGAHPLPLDGPALGLKAGWQTEMTAAGSYADLYDGTVGVKSALGLPHGLNALWSEGGLLCPPYSE